MFFLVFLVFSCWVIWLVKLSKINAAASRKQIREAQGRSEAIITVQTATAKGIEMIRKAGADDAFLRLEAYKAMVEVSKGQATKLVIPSDMQGIVGLASSLKEAITEPTKK